MISPSRLAQLYHEAPAGCLTFDEKGFVREWNRVAAELFGLSLERKKIPLSKLVCRKDVSKALEHVKRCCETDDNVVATEFNFRTKKNEVPVRLLSHRIALDGKRLFQSQFVRIDAKRRTEQLLRETAAYAEKIFQTVRQPLLVVDSDLRVISANCAFRVLFRRSANMKAGKFFGCGQEFGRETEKVRTRLRAAIRQKKSFQNFQIQLKTRAGRSRLLLLSAQPFLKNRQEGPFILLSFEDVERLKQTSRDREHLLKKLRDMAHQLEARVEARTEELQRVNSRLQMLSARLLEAQEMERRHLARELHDEIGQQITCLQILIEKQALLCPAPLKKIFKETQRATAELLETVRQLSAELRPQLLDDFGLVAALEWHLKRFRRRTGIHVKLNKEFFRDDLLNSFLRNVLFRIAQEALTNVARHSGADEAWIVLSTRKGICRLQIADHGKGFDMQSALQQGSVGLAGMQERIFLAGGKLKIESAREKGTVVEIELPLIMPHTDALDFHYAPEPS